MLISEAKTSEGLCTYLDILYQAVKDHPKAFDDIITRLSVYEENLYLLNGSGEYPPKDGVTIAYQELSEEFLKIYDEWKSGWGEERVPDWMRPIREYIKSMRTISNDRNLRQTCYVLLDGTKSLVRLSRDLLSLEQSMIDCENESDARSKQEDRETARTMLRIIFEDANRVLEHMIRMEGESVHYPETRPLIYDIPANLLELYLCMSHRCLTYYEKREPRKTNHNRKQYRILINPCLCPTILIRNSANDSNAEEEAICIDIPIRLLYDPNYVICHLVHEVSHYGGEEVRCRKDRRSAIEYCTAYYIASVLQMDDCNEVIRRIAEFIHSQIGSVGNGNDAWRFIHKLKPRLWVIVHNIAKSRRQLSDWYVFYGRCGYGLKHNTLSEIAEISEEDEQFIFGVINELCYLFRETYADLSMALTLNLSETDYASVISRELSFKDPDSLTFSIAVERVALVIYTLRSNPKRNSDYLTGKDAFEQAVMDYIQWLTSDADKRESLGVHYHYFEAAACLCRYLNTCLKTINEYDSLMQETTDEAGLAKIQNNYNNFAIQSRFASNGFFAELDLYRKQLVTNE